MENNINNIIALCLIINKLINFKLVLVFAIMLFVIEPFQ